MSRRPTDIELLDAAREHIAKVAATLTDPRLKFQTLVTAHVVGVVTRELIANRWDPDAESREREAVLALKGHPTNDAELCAAIRAGNFDQGVDAAALLNVLRARVDADVTVWNPTFLPRVRGG